jgi:hypothetical protein
VAGRKTVFGVAELVTLFIVVIAGAVESLTDHGEFPTRPGTESGGHW